jgi:hypothetical protein
MALRQGQPSFSLRGDAFDFGSSGIANDMGQRRRRRDFFPPLSEQKRIFSYSIPGFWSFWFRPPRGLFVPVHTCSFPAKGCQGVSWFQVESGAA